MPAKSNSRHLTIISLIALLTILSLGASAQTLYGRIDLELGYLDRVDTSFLAIRSNSSRFGMKGKFEQQTNSSYFVHYKIEFGISPNEPATNIKRRNSFIAINHNKFGQFLVGIHDSSVKLVRGKIDIFNDTRVDLKNFHQGNDRVANVIHWQSNKFKNGLQFLLTLPTNQDDVNSDFADSYSFATKYKTGKFYFGIGVNSKIDEIDSLTRFGASYKNKNLKLGLLHTTYENAIVVENINTEKQGSGTTLSFSYKLPNAWTVLAQYSDSSSEETVFQAVPVTNTQSSSSVSLGISKKLPKRNMVMFYLADNDDETIVAGRFQIKF